MSTEGSVGIAINITEDFATVATKAETLTTSIRNLDTAIGTKQRTINVNAILVTTEFDTKIAAVEAREHAIKIKIDPAILQKSITDAIGETAHVIRATVNLADVNTVIASNFAEPHPINVTVDDTDLNSKLTVATKNKSYPVKIDFTPDSAVGNSLSGISTAMQDIARLTGEINKLTKTALGDLNAQMTTYFNDLNHILDLTNKVAETVEKSVTKKASIIEKAAAKELADANKLAEKQVEIEEKKSAEINKLKVKEFESYVSGSKAMVDQRIKLEESEVQALRDLNQRKVENFQSMIRVILDGQNLVIDNYKKEQDAINATIEAKKRLATTSANLGAGTFENTGRTGSKQQTNEVTLPVGLGGTGIPLSKQQADADLLHKQGVDGLRSYNEQVAVITHEANSAHEKEFLRAFSFEEYMTKKHTEALGIEAKRYSDMLTEAYDMNKKITDTYHNTVIKAYSQQEEMDKKHDQALIEDMSRYNKMHQEALTINEKLTNAHHNEVIKAFQREEDMTKKHEQALLEDAARYNALHQEALNMNLKIISDYETKVIEAFQREEDMAKKHSAALIEDEKRSSAGRLTRGAALGTGAAMITSAADVRALREYREEQQRTQSTTQGLHNAMSQFSNVMMQLGVFMSVRQLTEYADQWIHFTSMVRIATNDYLAGMKDITTGAQLLNEAQKDLFQQREVDKVFKISQDTRTGIHDTAMLYSRMARAVESMEMPFEKAQVLTEQLGKAMMVMGINPQMARGALLQLEQALGGVVVRGQEFKSVNDGLPIVMRLVAKEYNNSEAHLKGLNRGIEDNSVAMDAFIKANSKGAMSLKDLRNLMLSGKMMSAVTADALTSTSSIEAMDMAAKHLHTTFAQAFTVIENGFVKYIGGLNEASGASSLFFDIAVKISNNFETIGTVLAVTLGPLAMFTTAAGLARVAVIGLNFALAANPFVRYAAILLAGSEALLAYGATHKEVSNNIKGYWDNLFDMWNGNEDPFLNKIKNWTAWLDPFLNKFNTVIEGSKYLFSLPSFILNKGMQQTEDAAQAEEKKKLLGSMAYDYSGVPKVPYRPIEQQDFGTDTLRGMSLRATKTPTSEADEIIKSAKEFYEGDAAMLAEVDNIIKKANGDNAKVKADLKELEAKNIAKLAISGINIKSIIADKYSEEAMSAKDLKIKTDMDSINTSIATKFKADTGIKDLPKIEEMLAMTNDQMASYAPKIIEFIKALQGFQKELKTQVTEKIAIGEAATFKEGKQAKLLGYESDLTTMNNKIAQLQEKGNIAAKNKPITLVTTIDSTKLEADVAKWKPLVAAASAKYKVPEALIDSVITQESHGNPKADSGEAIGLMQIKYSNLKSMGVTDGTNPEQSINAGTQYLARLIKMFDGDIQKVIAAYNMGENAFKKANEDFSKIPKETKDFVKVVGGNYQKFSGGEARTETVSQEVPTKTTEELNKLIVARDALEKTIIAFKKEGAGKAEEEAVKAAKDRLSSVEQDVKAKIDLDKTDQAGIVARTVAQMKLNDKMSEFSVKVDESNKLLQLKSKIETMLAEDGAKANLKAMSDKVIAEGLIKTEELNAASIEEANAKARYAIDEQKYSADLITTHERVVDLTRERDELLKELAAISGGMSKQAKTAITAKEKLKTEAVSTSMSLEPTREGSMLEIDKKIADYKKAIGDGFDAESEEWLKSLEKSAKLKIDVKFDNAAMAKMKTQFDSLATSLSNNFGKTGASIGAIVKALGATGSALVENNGKVKELTDGYETQKKVVDEKYEKDKSSSEYINGTIEQRRTLDNAYTENSMKNTKDFNDQRSTLEMENIQLAIGGAASIAGAAEEMFAKDSKGRKAAHAIAVGFHVIEMGMSIAMTAVKVAEGAAKMFAVLGPWGFAAVGAMLAVMAGLGIAGASSGGTKDTTEPDSKSTGSVLGDNEAASQSVKNVVDTLNNIHVSEYAALLQISNDFKDLSRAISATVLLAVKQSSSFTGSQGSLQNSGTSAMAMVTGFLTAGLTGLLGAVLFGIGSVKFDVIGYGIVTKATTLLLDGAQKAITVYDFSKIKKTTTGWFSDSVQIFDIINGVNSKMTNTLSSVFTSLGKTLKDVGKALDITEYMDTSFVVPKLKMSFTKLKSDEISKKIEDTLNTTMDNITEQVTNGLLTPFVKMGEGALEAFTRIGTQTVVIKETFRKAGYDLGVGGLGLISITQSLMTLYESSDKAKDGLKNFTSAFDALMKTITNAGEKLNISLTEMKAKLLSLNTQSTQITTKSTSVDLNTKFVDVLKTATSDITSGLTTAVTKVLGNDKSFMGWINYKTTINPETGVKVKGTEVKLTDAEMKQRYINLYGEDAAKNKTNFTLTKDQILSLTSEQLKTGGLDLKPNEVISSFSRILEVTERKNADTKYPTWIAALKAMEEAQVSLEKSTQANIELQTIIKNPTAENLAPYVTGGLTDTSKLTKDDLAKVATNIGDAIANKVYSPTVTASLATSAMPNLVPQVKLPENPLELTGQSLQKAIASDTENLARMSSVTTPITNLLLYLKKPDISTMKTVTGNQYEAFSSGIYSGKYANMTKSGTTAEDKAYDFSSLTSDKLSTEAKKGLFGAGMTTDTQGAWQTNNKSYNAFYVLVAKMIENNDKAVKEIASMTKDASAYLTDKFTNKETGVSTLTPENQTIVANAIKSILSMTDVGEQIAATNDLLAAYGSQTDAINTHVKTLTDAEPYIRATLQGIIDVKDLAESALSKTTTESQTKTRVNANSLLDLNAKDDISAVVSGLGDAGKQLLVNARNWIATQSAEQIANLGMTASINTLISAEDEAAGKIFMTEKALKAFDNAMDTLKSTMDTAKSALTNFQKSISDWVQGMKITQVGNTKSQMDEASKQFDALLLRIKTPTSAEDKNLAMTKITGAADAYLGAVKNYYGTSKAGADITANVIGMMDTLPDSLTVQELMLGELQKIKDNTAAMPKFEGMSQTSTDTIDTLSKAIAAAMAIDKTNPTLANTAALDAKANVMLTLSKAVAGATSEDTVFLENLVSAIGGGKGLSATIDATIAAKLGATTTADILGTLKTSFAALELEIEKVKLNPTQENIDKMQEDINTFKTLTANINGAVTALGLDPENPKLIKDVQDSLNAMNTFTATIANVKLTSDVIAKPFDDLKAYFKANPIDIFPTINKDAQEILLSDLKKAFESVSTTINAFIIDNDQAAKAKTLLEVSFSTITAIINSTADVKTRLDALAIIQETYANIEALVKSKVDIETQGIAYDTLTKGFKAIDANIVSKLEPTQLALVQQTLKDSFSAVNDFVYMSIDQKSKEATLLEIGKAYAGLSATVTVASKLGDNGAAAVNSLTAALSVVTATINNVKLNPTADNIKALDASIAAYGPLHAAVTAAITALDTNLDPTKTAQLKTDLQTKITALGAFTADTTLKLSQSQTDFLKQLSDYFGLASNRLTVFTNIDTTTAIKTLDALKTSYSTLKQTVEVLPAGDLATAAKTFVTNAFSGITGVVNAANISDTAKQNIFNSLDTSFKTYTAFIGNASVSDGAKLQASNTMTAAVSAITATIAKTNLAPDIQTTTTNALNGALSSIQVLLKDVMLNPTAANQNTLLTQLKSMNVAIDNVSGSVTKLDTGTTANKAALTTQLQKDITSLSTLTANVGLGLKDTAKTELDTAVSKIAPTNIDLTVKFTSWDAVSKKVVDNMVTIKDMGDKGLVFNITLPEIGLAPIQNLINEVTKATNEVIKMIGGFDSMLTKAADVQKAISLFATGNKVIEAYVPLKGEVRNKTGYANIEAINQMKLGDYLSDVAGASASTWQTKGQYTIKSEAAALVTGQKMYDVFNNPLSKYNQNLSYVRGYNETHEKQITDMEVDLVSDDMLVPGSYSLGMTQKAYSKVGNSKKVADAKLAAENADYNTAMNKYKEALTLAKAQAQNYFTLMGFNASSAAPNKFAEGGTFTNGIVNTPTSFNMGLMGEAGPEAIMPLVQTSGGLGVRTIMPAANDNNKYAEEELAEVKKQNQILMAQNAILQEGFKQLINVNSKQAESLDNIESTNRRAAA